MCVCFVYIRLGGRADEGLAPAHAVHRHGVQPKQQLRRGGEVCLEGAGYVPGGPLRAA